MTATGSEIEAFIEHYGKKGMHWGIHTEKDFYRTTTDSRRAQELKKRPLRALTNKQLQTVNNRMNLETQFSKMNPSKTRKGLKVAGEILAVSGTIGGLFAIAESRHGALAIKYGEKVVRKALSGSGRKVISVVSGGQA